MKYLCWFYRHIVGQDKVHTGDEHDLIYLGGGDRAEGQHLIGGGG